MSKPLDPKGYAPKEIFQKIRSEDQWEVDLDLDPEKIPWIYIGNIIQRVLARMVGQGPYGPVTVKCTKDGSLAVVGRGGAFDAYERQEWAFKEAGEVKEFTLDQQVERIDIFTYSDRVEYELTRDLVKDYGAKIELFEDSFYSLDFYTRRVRATCVSYTPKAEGTSDSGGVKTMTDADVDFIVQKVEAGHMVANIADQTFATVTVVAQHTLTLSASIFAAAATDLYTIEGPRSRLMGWFQAKD